MWGWTCNELPKMIATLFMVIRTLNRMITTLFFAFRTLLVL